MSTANLSKKSDLSASVGYVSSDTRFVENDNSVLTITGSAETSTNPPDVMDGWYYTPAQLFAELATRAWSGSPAGSPTTCGPTSWLTTRATLGYDIVNRKDIQFFPTGQVAPLDQNNDGVRSDNRFQISQTSVDLGGHRPVQAQPGAGLQDLRRARQFFRDQSSGTLVTGRGLVPGLSDHLGRRHRSRHGHAPSNPARSASFVEEEIGLKERLFVTGALRFDDNSAFGKNFNATVYPKASASWLVSDEPFFHSGFVNTLRLRGRLGVSGQQPGTTDALRYFTPVAGKKDGDGRSSASLSAASATPTSSRSGRGSSSSASTRVCSTTGCRSSSPTTTS